MCNSPQYLRNGAAKRCAICDGRFGLIRLLLPNCTLFKEVRRSLQVLSGGRSQMVTPTSGRRLTTAAAGNVENFTNSRCRSKEAAR